MGFFNFNNRIHPVIEENESNEEENKLDETTVAMQELIAEQILKEKVEVWRRGFCLEKAVQVLDDVKPSELISMAQAIYAYVYEGNVD